MRTKFNTLSEKISLSVPAIQLPRSSIHDAYELTFSLVLSNTSGAGVTPTAAEILGAIEQVAVTSDNATVHYALSGLDIARRDACKGAGNTDTVIEKTFPEIGEGASKTVQFSLFMDEGDICAVAHNSLELKVAFNTTVKTGVTLTSATVTTTIIEKIPTAAELIAMYGENFEFLAEPKCYAMSVSIPANTEFTGALDLPTGTLLNSAMLHFSADPSQIGILQNVPDRAELMKIDWAAMRAIDERKYRTAMPAGVCMLDYGTQWQSNGLGKNGWSYNKGDIQIGVKIASAATLRYVSFERVVNTAVFNSTQTANIGASFV